MCMSERRGKARKRETIAQLVDRFTEDQNTSHAPEPSSIDPLEAKQVARRIALAATLATIAPTSAFAQNAPSQQTGVPTTSQPTVTERARLKSLIEDVAQPDVQITSGDRISDDDISCLIKNIYHEARGEPDRGQLAVALVTLARSQDSRFANSVCGVVYQKNQYSWTREVQLMEKEPPETYRKNMRALLDMLITGKKYADAIGLLAHMLELPTGTLYYKRTDWSHVGTTDTRMSEKSKKMWRALRPVGEIGNHTFYTD